MINKIFFSLFLFALLVAGCANKSNSIVGCKPVLFPYVEYDYRPDIRKLENSNYKVEDYQFEEIFGMKVSLTKKWKREVPFDRTYKFFSGDKFFLISLESNSSKFDGDLNGINLVGCNNFSSQGRIMNKQIREFYYDLFFLTSNDVGKRSDFWKYFILWNKTGYFKEVKNLTYYKNTKVEAFQRNFEDIARINKGLKNEIVIFHESLKSYHLVLASNFSNQDFIDEFLTSLGALN